MGTEEARLVDGVAANIDDMDVENLVDLGVYHIDCDGLPYDESAWSIALSCFTSGALPIHFCHLCRRDRVAEGSIPGEEAWA